MKTLKLTEKELDAIYLAIRFQNEFIRGSSYPTPDDIRTFKSTEKLLKKMYPNYQVDVW